MSERPTTRRRFLAIGMAGSALPIAARAQPSSPPATPLTVLHLTDVHIRPEHDAPERCARILRKIRESHPELELVINTGDSIYAADYPHITRERVLEQWKLWDDVVMAGLDGIPMIHAIGNHDPWWAAPEDDPMHGFPYVCKRLGIEKENDTTRHGGWEIITLNNARGSIDDPQRDALFQHLESLDPDQPVLIASHLPLYSLAGDYAGGNMRQPKPLVDRLADRKGPVVALSGHIHVHSREEMWNIRFHCNGALSGSWWEPGKAGDGSYARTPPGYAILKLWPDGRSECRYHPT